MTRFLNKLPFAHHAWFMYLRLLVRHFLDDNCTQKAASLTYTTLLSIVPMIAILLVVFSTVPALESVREQVQTAIYNNLLPSSSNQVIEYIDNFAKNLARFTLVGISVLLFTTVSMLITIETAFNQIWRIEEKTGGLKSILHYVAMIICLPIVLAVAFMASSTIQSLHFLNKKIGGYGIDWAIWAEVASFGFVVLGFIGIYFLLPKVKVPFKNAVIAGIVIAILFECVKRFFGLAVSNFTSYQAVYGAFAVLPIFLMWVYLSWNLILLGVEISYTLTIFDSKELPVRHPLLSLLDMVNLIYKNQKNQKSTSKQEIRAILGRKELPKWQTYLRQLESARLIQQTHKGNYRLRTDLDSVSLWQFYRSLPYPLPIKDELIALEQTEHDLWSMGIYDKLKAIENQTRTTLDMPLSNLFDNAPVRQKQSSSTPIEHSSANPPSDTITDGDAASFSPAASQVKTDNQTLLIPNDTPQHKTPHPIVKNITNKGQGVIQKIRQFLGK